jgi:hypothetical protein
MKNSKHSLHSKVIVILPVVSFRICNKEINEHELLTAAPGLNTPLKQELV